jgi:DNA polymerase family A
MLNDYDQLVFADFEFVAKPGEHPDVVCLAWHEWPAGRTCKLWRDELGDHPPYRVDAKALFVCFVGNAELACHLALDWPLPVNVLDLYAEFRAHVNGRHVPAGKGLLGALAYFGLDSIGSKRKDALRQRIMQGWPFTAEERAEILRYCASDVDAMVRLLPQLLPHIDLPAALHRGAFVAVSAQMEHVGVPIDPATFPALADKSAWRFVRDAMVPEIDAQYGVYVRSKDGEWHFNMEKFAAFLQREGIVWPVTEQGALATKSKTFEEMAKGYPQLESLRQLRHTRDKMRKIKLAVGDDDRNRTVLWPFQSKTSRTQPKASQWIFSPAVWLRSLIAPAAGRAVAYVDWSSMEFMIAACLSSDPIMLEFYRSGDPYLTFAKRVGAAPPDAIRRTHEALRDRYKTGLLAIQYGIGAASLAARLGVSVFEAHEMLGQHRELFARYWRWADDWLAAALDSGEMRTALGWQCCTGITEFNSRSIMNWPVQSTGAEILRIACVWAARYRLTLCAPIHDALLIEAPIERIDADVALLEDIMRRSSRVVLNAAAGSGHELRTDATIVRHPDRYSDKRGVEIWDRVRQLLGDNGALTETQEASYG